MRHKLIFLLTAQIALLFSCTPKVDDSGLVIDDIETYIEQSPDSALYVLQNIKSSSITNDGVKAKHALLLSMAMDKTFIEATDFQILQPAIDHYKKHGSSTDRLRMYYYKGRIFKNSGNDEKAMECYVMGLYHGKHSNDSLTIARTLYSKALIHNKLYQFDKYVECMLEAAKYFKEKKQSSYFKALLSAHNGCIILNDTIKASAIIDTLSSVADNSNLQQMADLYEAKIAHANKFHSSNASAKLIDDYINSIKEENIKWLSVAAVLYKIGKYDDCLKAIRYYEKYYPERPGRYYAILSGAHENLQDYSEALKNYKKYIKISDSLDMAIFKNDTKFIEEKYNLQIEKLEESRQNHIRISILVSVAFALSGLLLHVRNKYLLSITEKENYILRCDQLENEKNQLEKIVEKDSGMKYQMKKVLMDRIAILNSFFIADIDKSGRSDLRARKELQKLVENRDTFINSTRAVYDISYPNFMQLLKEKQLTDLEINYCCLYAIGLRIKDVGNYMRTSTHYNINVSIRKKLGLESNATNLDIYIRRMLQEL